MANPNAIAPVLLAISVVLLAAKLGGALAVRLRQPAVLGELLVGILLGNAVLVGFQGFEFLRPPKVEPAAQSPNNVSADAAASTLQTLARLGVIILLFEIGLEARSASFARLRSRRCWSRCLVSRRRLVWDG